MGYKFDSQKYITSGVRERIPLEILLMMFGSIEFMRRKTDGELDYLQVFKLETIGEDGNYLLSIRHEQEVPEAKIDIVVPVSETINEKVYVIDDVEHVTMLLAEEY